MTKIFLSHATSDGAAIAMDLVHHLEAAGHTCWIAPRDVKAGRTYPAQITSAIREAAGLVVVVTTDANESTDVLQEVQLAHTQRKMIVPIIVSKDGLSDDLSYFLSVRHQLSWTNATDILPFVLHSLPVDESSVSGESAPIKSSVLTPQQAITAAASNEDGVTGVFGFEVKNANFSDGKLWLNSEEDYRDQRCLAVAIEGVHVKMLAAEFGGDPVEFLSGKQVEVSGTARRRKIVFLHDRKFTGLYYFQTQLELQSVNDLKVLS